MKSFRSAIFWVHLAVGAAAGLVVLIMSVTGVALTYEKQMLEWSDRRAWTAPSPANARQLPPETLLAHAAAARPGTAPTGVTLRADAAAPATVTLEGNLALLVDPYTGAIIGEPPTALRSFFRTMTAWHRYLALDGASRVLRYVPKPAGERTDWPGRWSAIRQSGGVICMLFLVIGGIYGGVFTVNEAAALGARVTLVSGPTGVPAPFGVDVVKVETARAMLDAVRAALPADIAIFAAAVADWRVASEAHEKIKKGPKGAPSLELVENPDILRTIAGDRPGKRPPLVIGFAAETENVVEHAKKKRKAKGADWIVANDVSPETGIMGGDRNTVHLITAHGIESWPELDKAQVAQRLVARAARWLTENTAVT